MLLQDLCVIHQSKHDCGTSGEFAALPAIEGAFCVDTCQRRLWITTTSGVTATWNGTPGITTFIGEDAYFFLLSVAAGLKSAVLGETDVFGQFKSAWKAFDGVESPLKRELTPWMQKLFEDTKEMRGRYLENLGGTSYGSLVRRTLEAAKTDRILIVGAGSIAQSVAPYLTEFELLLWNRSRPAVEKLASQLAARGASRVHVFSGADQEQKAWMQADHAVVAIPTDTAHDPRRIELWNARPTSGKIVHLGCLRAQASASWTRLAAFRALDDLFAMKDSQHEVRDFRIEKARKACHDRARLRAMGGSISIAHGWEDLAAFN